ncbi:ABC transporter permease [Burkholderia sp. Bp8994]|uniref:ABC transporter permease n=1 Tax=unclassified Burkholderia TaxID=2613784 RepID=UPI000F5B3B9E|nr:MULTISPECIES: ABC transporter permease [unclassified Burkholderia]RQS00565.1 ABC transporter permease [Burkholderia sp. Bp8994]RQS44162.1 ABC transporter permease [Burkholderia sp. Bp8990]RQZ49405.1 ABC transporter permease [Burkholderia sp. Bp9099]
MTINNIKKHKLFMGIVVVPMILALAYYIVLAQDRFTSTSEVVVKKVGSNEGGSGGGAAAAQASGLSVLLGGGASSSLEETLYVREFVLSQDMLNVLQERLHWSDHYAGRLRDPWYYLSPNASKEKLLKYYQRMVTASFDESTGLLTIRVQAFDREFAEKSLKTIIAESDNFVNSVSHRLALEQVEFAESEVERARDVYDRKRDTVLAFQGNNNVLDAQRSALARNDVISQLQAEEIKADTALRAMRASLSENSPQVRQQQIRVQALRQQIAVEQNKLTAKSSDNQMNVVAARFRNLELDARIAEDMYKASAIALNEAHNQAAKKLRALVVIVNPNMPDESLLPRRFYNLFTILVILLLVYGVTRFVIATIKDHRD